MRTMLILLFICSLAQFAIADSPNPFSPEGCGTIYTCLAPRYCTNQAIPMASSDVKTLDKFDKIYNTCPALIVFQTYGKHWVHVTIESIADTTTSIEFVHSTQLPKTVKNTFSCKPIGGKLEGSYGPKKKVSKIFDLTPTPIKCEFQVKLSGNQDLFAYTSTDIFQISINMETAKAETTDANAQSTGLPLYTHCDPSRLEVKNDLTDMSKVYAKVQYSRGAYLCNLDNIFTMEYRKEATDDQYAQNVQLTCAVGNPPEFKINGQKADPLDVRCVADAKFFCNANAVKEEGGTGLLLRTQPDKPTRRASELKCPTDHPHLFVKGRPVFNEEIKCVNYGGSSQVWTVGHQTLTEKGPDVYCSNIIQCQTLYKIPESAVEGGSVDKDYLPFCHGKGILQDANKANIEPPFVQCDTSTGNYTYTVGTEKKIVQKDTKFECFHPVVSNDAQNLKDKKTLTFGTIAASVAAALIVVGASVAMWFFARRRIRIRNAKSADMDKKLFDAFATNNDEKEAAKQAIKQATHVNEDVGKHSEFNEMLISVQYDAVCSFSTGRTDGLYDSPPQSDIIDMPAKPTWRKTPRKEDVAKFPKSHTAGKLEPSEMNDVHKRVYDRLTQFTLKKMMMRKKK